MKKLVSTIVVRASVAAALVAGVWVSLTPRVQAKGGAGGTITITPIGTLKAGPDFATDVLGDPWDFSNRADVTLDPNQIDGFSATPTATDGYLGFSVANGVAGGTTSLRRDGTSGGSYFNVLSQAWDGLNNPGRNGRNFPIDSTTYTVLSFKMNLGSGAGNNTQLPRVYWYHNDIGVSGGEGSRYVDDVTPTIDWAVVGNGIYSVDLTSGKGNDQGIAWTSGPVKGLGLFPNSTGSGFTATFDWVRLTTGSANPAAAVKQLTWSGNSGSVTINVTDAAGTVFKIASGVSGTSYNFNYGILPPGNYTLSISDGSNSGTAAFTINTPPLIQVTDPDETGGQDFATTVLGNAWDMSASNDIVEDPCCIVDHLINESFTNGVFNATGDGVTVGFAGSTPTGDPQVYFLSNPRTSNTTDVIDTTKYHRLTFDLQVDRAFDLGKGSIARVFWGSDSTTSNALGGYAYSNLTATKDFITWPGKNNYTLDLSTLTTASNGGLEAGGTPWTQKAVRHFRIDPYEFAEQVPFHIDNVKLAADDETLNNSFTIHWTASDPDAGQSPTVTLFYDTDKNPASGLVQIATGLPMSSGQYAWSTAGVPAGTYYIYAVISDGLNTSAQYSTGPLKVSNAAAPSNPQMSIDAPANGATVTAAFEIGGWAIDTGAASGTGIDGFQYYIYPNDGADPAVFLGTGSYGAVRADIGALYGSQFTNSGYHFTVTGMTPGKYLLAVYAHSNVSNSYVLRTSHITVNANTLESIDIPSPEATVASGPFAVGGWAIDRRSTTGVGVDLVHVYAYPNPTASPAPAPIFLGQASLGVGRPDVAAFYGSQYANSGYVLNLNTVSAGLAPGLYNIAVWARSTVDGSFNNVAVVRITIQ